MSFGRPVCLWFLVLIPFLSLYALRGLRLRTRAWGELAQRGKVPGDRSAAMIIAAGLLILALAQPRFGRPIGPPLPPGQDVVLLVDVSRSMGAEDAVPDRLTVATEAASSLVEALADDPASRAGVVAFAGRGVLRCPLSENLGAVNDALRRLRPGTVRPGGTDLAAGLDAALDAFGQDEHSEGRAIVVFSDGEDHAGNWRSRLDRLAKAGAIVHAVAIGDPDQGHPVPAGPANEPLKYEGETVLSRRDDSALEAVAGRTQGAMIKLGLARADLGTLYRERIAPAARRKRELARIPDRPERFPLFLASGLGFAFAGCWPAGSFRAWRRVWGPAILALLLAALSLALLGARQGETRPRKDGGDRAPRPPSARAEGSGLAELMERGQTAYAAGRFEEARDAFESAIAAAPERPIPHYNAAAALFQLERYDAALERYQQARAGADAGLRTKIDFALGNTALALGDVTGAVAHYDRCVESTARGPGLDEVRRDAAINRAFAIEQARSAMSSEGESDADQPPTKSRNRSPGDRDRGGDEQGPNESTGGDQGTERGGNGPRRDQPPRARRRTGRGAGAGSGRQAGSPGDTPDDRLDAALDAIRDAERRRLPEESPSEPAGDDRKDW